MWRRAALGREFAKQNGEQAARAKEIPLAVGVEIDADRDRIRDSRFTDHVKPEHASRRDAGAQAAQPECLPPGEGEGDAIDAVEKHQRKNADGDEVRSVDALEGLGEHGSDAETTRTLGGPIA